MTKNIENRPLIGITLGDPSGIGPEVTVKALTQDPSVYDICRPVVFGDRAVIQRETENLKIPVSVRVIDTTEPAAPRKDIIQIIECSQLDPRSIRYGLPCPEGSTAMATSIVRTVDHALDHRIDAMVTAPINKQALNSAGYRFPGHTEMIAHLAQAPDVVMMLAGAKLKVALVTIHCALSEVPGRLSTETVLKTIRITDHSLKRFFSTPRPRLAVAGLNPHAGEEQMFGTEETRVILPAVHEAVKQGIDATGPAAPDTVFYFAAQAMYDAVICMYHDQGLIPLKLLHFDDAVNITLGLPIIRTSVDHGTAYNIAGNGTASPSSMINAIKTAALMATSNRAKIK